MIKKIFLLSVFIFCITLPNVVKASPTNAISNIYTEGFYSFDNSNDVDLSITLTTDAPTKILILDNEMNIEYMSRLPYNYKFYLRGIKPGKIIGIVEEGKVGISFAPAKESIE